MPVEQREQVIGAESEPTGNRMSSNSRRKAAVFDFQDLIDRLESQVAAG